MDISLLLKNVVNPVTFYSVSQSVDVYLIQPICDFITTQTNSVIFSKDLYLRKLLNVSHKAHLPNLLKTQIIMQFVL